MKLLKDILDLSTHFLSEKGISNARRQAEEVISDALGVKRLQLYLEFDRPLNQEEIDHCRAFLSRRGNREPSQYIRGQVDFFDCVIKVTPDVLIPRQETEILVDIIAQSIKDEEKTLWDLCCGSGCIGIALKKRFPRLSVTLSDISPKALALAKENAENNGVAVSFLEGDLLGPFAGQKADYIVCNPPYISTSEYETLEPEVRLYEPKTALVAGESGLEFYERLAKELPSHLNPGANVWFEIGHTQGKTIKSLFNLENAVQRGKGLRDSDSQGKSTDCHITNSVRGDRSVLPCGSEDCGDLPRSTAFSRFNGEVLQDWAGHDRFFAAKKC